MLCSDCINRHFCYGDIVVISENGRKKFICDEYSPEYDEELLKEEYEKIK